MHFGTFLLSSLEASTPVTFFRVSVCRRISICPLYRGRPAALFCHCASKIVFSLPFVASWQICSKSGLDLSLKNCSVVTSYVLVQCYDRVNTGKSTKEARGVKFDKENAWLWWSHTHSRVIHIPSIIYSSVFERCSQGSLLKCSCII